MIEYVKGDLFRSGTDAIVNPVNTVGTMGKGLALQFSKRFPWCAKPYRKACDDGRFNIGDALLVKSYAGLSVIHVPTKEHWKDPSQIVFVEKGLEALRRTIDEYDIKSVAVPALGCGLGGLLWSDVKPLFDRAFDGCKATVLVYLPQGVEKT